MRPCRLLLWQLLLRWCHMATGEDRGLGGGGDRGRAAGILDQVSLDT